LLLITYSDFDDKQKYFYQTRIKEELNKLKKVPRDSYNDIIDRLIKENKEKKI